MSMRRESILIVDDEPVNIKLMKAMLMPQGYEILEALHGEEAINRAFRSLPDLILLDVMMPGLNGYDVCERLKADARTKPIPIIMVTALKEQAHQLKAMQMGADDFISKPVDRFELTIRVKSLLRIKKYQDDLLFSSTLISRKNSKLQELEQMRDDLIHMIVHDLRNPLAAVMGLIDLTLLDREQLPEPLWATLKNCSAFCNEMSEQIENLLAVQRMENAQPAPEIAFTDVPSLVDETVEQFRLRAQSKGVSLSFVSPRNLTALPMDRALIKRVIANLLQNAIRHTPSQGRVEGAAQVSPEGRTFRVSVKDTGYGLDPEHHEKVFNKFEQVKLRKEGVSVGSSGLGLAFCKMAIEAHGGRIWVESGGPNEGCIFCFEIPISLPGGAS